jgi:uncharacterized protein involved in type VI secretion and phage assembly
MELIGPAPLTRREPLEERHARTSNSKYVREVRTGRSINHGLHPHHLAYVLGGKYVLIEVRAATPV